MYSPFERMKITLSTQIGFLPQCLITNCIFLWCAETKFATKLNINVLHNALNGLLFGVFLAAGVSIMLIVWLVTPMPTIFHLLCLFLGKVWWVLKKQGFMYTVQTVELAAVVLTRASAWPWQSPAGNTARLSGVWVELEIHWWTH